MERKLSTAWTVPSDPFALAEEFVAFVNREWSGKEQAPGDLFGYFTDWAQDAEADLISRTGGNRMKAVETFLIIVGWFGTDPEDFAPIEEAVKIPLVLARDARRLPSILDEDVWNHHVFARKYGGAKH